MLSKKDYVQFARIIRTQKHKIEHERLDFPSPELDGKDSMLDSIVDSLVTMFESDNPQFDKKRFLDACELPVESS